MKTKEFKVGDKVFDIRYGWGKVVGDKAIGVYSIYVTFDRERNNTYTKEGKEHYTDSSPSLSHTEYSIHSTQSEYPKVMEVSYSGFKWYKRVVLAKKGEMFIAWMNAETLEEAEDEKDVRTWYLAREVQEHREISIQEIADKFGIPVEEVRIKK